MNGNQCGKNKDEIKDYIAQGQTILTMTAFRFWLESVAQWLKAVFPNSDYAAEWLAEFILRSTTIENQFRRLAEIDSAASSPPFLL